MFTKIFGLGLFIVGFIMATRFSFIVEAEHPFSRSGTAIGIIICIIGLILMVS